MKDPCILLRQRVTVLKGHGSCLYPEATLLKPAERNQLPPLWSVPFYEYCFLLCFANVLKSVIMLTFPLWIISSTFLSRTLPKHRCKKISSFFFGCLSFFVLCSRMLLSIVPTPGFINLRTNELFPALLSGKLVKLWNWLWWGVGSYFHWPHWIKGTSKEKTFTPCKMSRAWLQVTMHFSPVGVTVWGNRGRNLFAVYLAIALQNEVDSKFLPKLSRGNTSKITKETHCSVGPRNGTLSEWVMTRNVFLVST